MSTQAGTFVFGQWNPSVRQIFHQTALSRCLVNIRPVVPGHVLIIPHRRTSKFAQLTPEEVSDLWVTAQKTGVVLEKHYGTDSLTFAMQDGPGSGQTVDHCHIHIIPRRKGDFEPNDQVYRALEADRKNRSAEEMEREADELRQAFTQITS